MWKIGRNDESDQDAAYKAMLRAFHVDEKAATQATQAYKNQVWLAEYLWRREDKLMRSPNERTAVEGSRKTCPECGQKAPRVFPVGATVQNKFTKAIGVVLGPGVYKYGIPIGSERPSAHVIVMTGAFKGSYRNWFHENIEVVHGIFDIRSREGF